MAKREKSLSSVVVLLIIIIATAVNSGLFRDGNKDNYNFKNEEFSELSQKENLLCVNFVDVGQGDCTVILLPDGKTIMIDAGENGHEEEVFEFLDRNGIKKIDYLVATHPHSDHIGGLYEVVCEYEIGEVFMPKTYHSTNTYLDLLEDGTLEPETFTVKENGRDVTYWYPKKYIYVTKEDIIDGQFDEPWYYDAETYSFVRR